MLDKVDKHPLKFDLTTKRKRRLIIWSVILAAGLLLIHYADTTPPNPPGDADIILGLYWFVGLGIAIISATVIAASVLYILVNYKLQKPRRSALITSLTIIFILGVCGYVFIGAHYITQSRYRAELQSRWMDFVAYQGVPNITAAHGQSTSIVSQPVTGNAQTATIDLHSCSPGMAKVTYAKGVAHFIFSGVDKNAYLTDNSSVCIVYIGIEAIGQQWDGQLPTKCTWPVSDELSYNQRYFKVTDKGVQFGDFLGNCQDLKTGIAPSI